MPRTLTSWVDWLSSEGVGAGAANVAFPAGSSPELYLGAHVLDAGRPDGQLLALQAVACDDRAPDTGDGSPVHGNIAEHLGVGGNVTEDGSCGQSEVL